MLLIHINGRFIEHGVVVLRVKSVQFNLRVLENNLLLLYVVGKNFLTTKNLKVVR